MYGAMAGVEPYQDEEGNWQVRYSPEKGLIGVGLMAGRKGLDDSLKATDDAKLKTQAPTLKAKEQPKLETDFIKELEEFNRGETKLPDNLKTEGLFTFHRVKLLTVVPPAVKKPPPIYTLFNVSLTNVLHVLLTPLLKDDHEDVALSHNAILLHEISPAIVKIPPAYKFVISTDKHKHHEFKPEPNDDHVYVDKLHCAILLHETPPAVVKSPPAYNVKSSITIQ
jgi:hypothetical protein